MLIYFKKKVYFSSFTKQYNIDYLYCFVYICRSFHFEDLRVDEALRLYLEAFRLPGEAPVISYLIEHFSEHWSVSFYAI